MNTPGPEGAIPGRSAPGGGEQHWTEQADHFAEEERLRRAVELRRRERWRRDRQTEESTISSVLRAGVGAAVGLHIAAVGSLQGRLAAVGVDVLAIEVAAGAVWVPLDAVQAVELSGRPGNEPAPAEGPTLAEVLEDLRGTQDVALITLAAGETVRGVIAAVGTAITVRSPDGKGHVVIDPEAIVMVAAR